MLVQKALASRRRQPRRLEEDLDHSTSLYTKEMEQQQLMCIATALRAEEGLMNHCHFLNERHSMKEAMRRKKAFEDSYAKDKEYVN